MANQNTVRLSSLVAVVVMAVAVEELTVLNLKRESVVLFGVCGVMCPLLRMKMSRVCCCG